MTSTGLLVDAAPGSAARLMQAFELPSTPALVGILVGAMAGVAVFVTVVALLARSSSRRARRDAAPADADDVVFIPPYAAHPAHGAPFVPSNALSARAFAKMGFAFGERVEGAAIDPFDRAMVAPVAAPAAGPVALADETGDALPVTLAGDTAPLRVLAGPPAPGPEDSAPNPLAIIPASSSAMMRAAKAEELPDLDYEDDGATQIGEPFFDEPPKPRTMGERPKIRPMKPAAPRFSAPLPPVAPPPAIPPEPPTVPRLIDAT